MMLNSKKDLLAILFLLTLWVPSSIASDAHHTIDKLCVDIGASKSRFCFMSEQLPKDEQELARLVVHCIDSRRPLNTKHIIEILPDCAPIDIHLGLPCPVKDGTPSQNELSDLKTALQERFTSLKKIICKNDAVSWLQGAMIYQSKFKELSISKPVLFISLGTATGLAYFDGVNYFPLELCDLEMAFPLVRQKLGLDENVVIGKWARYCIVGNSFWSALDDDPTALKSAIHAYKLSGQETLQYRALLNAFIVDLINHLSSINLNFKKIILGGGNTRNLDNRFFILDYEILILNKETLGNIDPDIIPMLSAFDYSHNL